MAAGPKPNATAASKAAPAQVRSGMTFSPLFSISLFLGSIISSRTQISNGSLFGLLDRAVQPLGEHTPSCLAPPGFGQCTLRRLCQQTRLLIPRHATCFGAGERSRS